MFQNFAHFPLVLNTVVSASYYAFNLLGNWNYICFIFTFKNIPLTKIPQSFAKIIN